MISIVFSLAKWQVKVVELPGDNTNTTIGGGTLLAPPSQRSNKNVVKWPDLVTCNGAMKM